MSGATERLTAALADRYVIERKLGQGGMATVYLATDVKHDRAVALKVLRPDLAAVLGAERFLAEIKITARLDHPHILTLIDSENADGFLYYVLPYVRGGSLRERLNKEKQLGLDEALSITRQISSALDYAHRLGIIHRDVKPENILFQEGEAVLTDFGIALAVRAAGGNRLTETGLSLGTPQYMSPEQATGNRDLDARSDVYSLGAVLYEMLAGEPPVTGANAQAMIAKLMTERPMRIRVVRDTVPEGVDAAVAKALSKVPADRFPDTGDFSAALVAAVQPTPIAPRSRRPLGWIVAAGVVALVAVGWALSQHGKRTGFVSPFATSIPRPSTTSGNVHGGALSPDGSQVAYSDVHCDPGTACRGDFVIRETDGQGMSTIYSEPGQLAFPMAWSPDGQWVLFYLLATEHGVVLGEYLVPQRGGVPRKISAAGFNFRGGFVAPDTLLMADADLDMGRTVHGPVWFRTVVASTGLTVDSTEIPTDHVLYSAQASRDGRWIAVVQASSIADTVGTVAIFDRAGRPVDSLRVMRPTGHPIVWTARPDAVILAPAQDGERSVVRRSLDDRGHFLPDADTLKVLDRSFDLADASADGLVLLLSDTRFGAREYWAATRAGAATPFKRQREVGSSTGALVDLLSPRGGWIISREPTGAGRNQWRLSIEPFPSGTEHIVDAAINGYQDFAVDPTDDSIAITSREGRDSMAVTIYPLPAGSPVRRGVFPGVIVDLEWLADGNLVAPVDSGRTIRIISPDNSIANIPVPDSIGIVNSLGRSPTRPAVAITSRMIRHGRLEMVVSTLDIPTEHFTVLARTSALLPHNGAWWTSDGWIHFTGSSFGFATSRLYRVRDSGGGLEAEPTVEPSPNAEVISLAQDDQRAIVSIRNTTNDLAVLRVQRPNAPTHR